MIRILFALAFVAVLAPQAKAQVQADAVSQIAIELTKLNNRMEAIEIRLDRLERFNDEKSFNLAAQQPRAQVGGWVQSQPSVGVTLQSSYYSGMSMGRRGLLGRMRAGGCSSGN